MKRRRRFLFSFVKDRIKQKTKISSVGWVRLCSDGAEWTIPTSLKPDENSTSLSSSGSQFSHFGPMEPKFGFSFWFPMETTLLANALLQISSAAPCPHVGFGGFPIHGFSWLPACTGLDIPGSQTLPLQCTCFIFAFFLTVQLRERADDGKTLSRAADICAWASFAELLFLEVIP